MKTSPHFNIQIQKKSFFCLTIAHLRLKLKTLFLFLEIVKSSKEKQKTGKTTEIFIKKIIYSMRNRTKNKIYFH